MAERVLCAAIEMRISDLRLTEFVMKLKDFVAISVLILVLGLTGCGGGSSAQVQPPPPPSVHTFDQLSLTHECGSQVA